MTSNGKITQEEVSAALYQFIQQGGHIEVLPDQNYRPSHPVGEEKYEMYETLSTLDSLAVPNDQIP